MSRAYRKDTMGLALIGIGMTLLLSGAIILALGHSNSNETAVQIGWCVFLSTGVPSFLIYRWFFNEQAEEEKATEE